jgi:HEPN domain-containing protein
MKKSIAEIFIIELQQYIEKYIKENNFNKQGEPYYLDNYGVLLDNYIYQFDIPKILTDKALWIENLEISVNVINYITDIEEELKFKNSGKNIYSYDDKFNKDRTKLVLEPIFFNIIAVNGDIDNDSFKQVVKFGIKNSYDVYEKILKYNNQTYISINHCELYFKDDNEIYRNVNEELKFTENVSDSVFKYIINEVINPINFKKHYIGVYDELKNGKCLEETKAYKFWFDIKNVDIPILEKLVRGKWEKYYQLFQIEMEPRFFRGWFLRGLYFMMNVFYLHMKKVASLWYNERDGFVRNTIYYWTDLKNEIWGEKVVREIYTPYKSFSERHRQILEYIDNM